MAACLFYPKQQRRFSVLRNNAWSMAMPVFHMPRLNNRRFRVRDFPSHRLFFLLFHGHPPRLLLILREYGRFMLYAKDKLWFLFL